MIFLKKDFYFNYNNYISTKNTLLYIRQCKIEKTVRNICNIVIRNNLLINT